MIYPARFFFQEKTLNSTLVLFLYGTSFGTLRGVLHTDHQPEGQKDIGQGKTDESAKDKDKSRRGPQAELALQKSFMSLGVLMSMASSPLSSRL